MLKFLDKHCSNLKETNQIPIIFQTINETGGFGYEKLVISGKLNIAGPSNSLKLSTNAMRTEPRWTSTNENGDNCSVLIYLVYYLLSDCYNAKVSPTRKSLFFFKGKEIKLLNYIFVVNTLLIKS